MKIVLVGAGSREFGPASIRDLLLSDALCDSGLDIVLMDLDASELSRTQEYAASVAERLGHSVQLSATTSLADALPRADAVVMAIELDRYFYWAQDFHIPRIFGFRQIYGENGGPGGLFHALRNMGPCVDVARAMEEHCPDAWLLNYTNPLTKLCEAQSRLSGVRVVGLCHGVFHGIEQMARLLELPTGRLDARASGINHFTWFESVHDRETGEDLYPRLKQREREAHLLHDWDEIALSRILYRVFGRFPSPGANHIGEYLGWAQEFLGSSALQFFYDPVQGAPWETGEVPTWIYNLADHPGDMPAFPGGPVPRMKPTREQRAAAAEALRARTGGGSGNDPGGESGSDTGGGSASETPPGNGPAAAGGPEFPGSFDPVRRVGCPVPRGDSVRSRYIPGRGQRPERRVCPGPPRGIGRRGACARGLERASSAEDETVARGNPVPAAYPDQHPPAPRGRLRGRLPAEPAPGADARPHDPLLPGRGQPHQRDVPGAGGCAAGDGVVMERRGMEGSP